MGEILIVKNITREGPGLLEALLKEKNIRYRVIDLGEGEKFPNPTGYKAVVVLGGPDSANDSTEKMKLELVQIKRAISANIPYLGICLGMQALVKATGGEIHKHTMKEIGWKDANGQYFEIELTREGMEDPIFQGLSSPLKVFQLHGEMVCLKSGMILLGTGKHCRNQVVKIGKNAYGIQAHFELTHMMFEDWIAHDDDLRMISANALKDDYRSVKPEYEAIGKKLLSNFLAITGLL